MPEGSTPLTRLTPLFPTDVSRTAQSGLCTGNYEEKTFLRRKD